MKSNTVKKVVMGSLLLVLMGQGFASANTGVYVEGSAGRVITYAYGDDDINKGSLKGKESFGVNLGYQANEHIGFEVGYDYYNMGGRDAGVAYEESANAYHFAFKGIAPVSKKIKIFGKLGLVHLVPNDKSDDDDIIDLPYLALGAAYAVTPKIDINFQVSGASFLIADLGSVNAGVTYHF